MTLQQVAVGTILFLAIHLKSWNVVPVLMALGNTYGLLLVSLLLGYGLVDVPVQLLNFANPERELRRTRILASGADEAVFEAVWELQDCETLIDAAASKIGERTAGSEGQSHLDPHYARCVDMLMTRRKDAAMLSPSLQQRRQTGNRRNGESDDQGMTDNDENREGLPSLEYLTKLHNRLQHAHAEVAAAEQRWNSIVAKNQLYSSLVEGTEPPESPTGQSSLNRPSSASRGWLAAVNRQLRNLWFRFVRRPFYVLLGMASAGLSFMVLWSEATLSLPFNASPFAILLRLFDNGEKEDLGVLFQVAALVPLLYMSICVYSSLFKLSWFGSFRLRGKHQSPGFALVFNAQYLVRLQFPLGYNYLFL